VDSLEVFVALSDKQHERLRSRLVGISDEEYLWEPAPGAWSVRGSESGDPHFDFGIAPSIQPVTTIAWRLTHIIDLLKEGRCAIQLGLEPEANAHELWVTTSADEAIRYYESAYETWRRYLSHTDPSALADPIEGGRWPDRQSFVLHIVDEVIHHGAEIGVLRDLWAAGQSTLLLTASVGDVAALDAAEPHDVDELRRLHPELMSNAAAAGRWDAVDSRFDGTPLQWAESMSTRLGGPQASGADWVTVIDLLTTYER
jgi:DinB superfamily